MKTTANMLAVLLQLYEGGATTRPNLDELPKLWRTLTLLVPLGLIDLSDKTWPKLSPKGIKAVDSVLLYASAPLGRPDTYASRPKNLIDLEWNAGSNASELPDAPFFMVASGECMARGASPRPTLRHPPSVVHTTAKKAEAEATRLAALQRGSKFFVLQAISATVLPAAVTHTKLTIMGDKE